MMLTITDETAPLDTIEKAQIRMRLRREAMLEPDPCKQGFMTFQMELIEEAFKLAQARMLRAATDTGLAAQLAGWGAARSEEEKAFKGTKYYSGKIQDMTLIITHCGSSSAHVRLVRDGVWAELRGEPDLTRLRASNLKGSMRDILALVGDAAQAARPDVLKQALQPKPFRDISWHG